MQPATLLHRQVHPNFCMEDGHIMSVAFRPFPKDDGLLSVYDGSQISAEACFKHYTATLKYSSAGVWAVSVEECVEVELPARPDAKPNFAEHAVIDFTGLVKKQVEAKAKVLAEKAETRGCLFRKAG
jgi:hypothetical protein